MRNIQIVCWSPVSACAGIALLLATSMACASATVTHTNVSNPTADESNRGIRYFGTSPYLIAYSDGKGGIVTQVSYLPDPAKKMSATPVGRLAEVKATMDFDRGVLTTSVEGGDATAVPKAIVEAVKTFAPLLLAGLKAAEPKQYQVPAPYIYKIVVQGNNVYFLGGQGETPVKITLLSQQAK